MAWFQKPVRDKRTGKLGKIIDEENSNRFLALTIEWEDGSTELVQMSNTVYDNSTFPESAYSHIQWKTDGYGWADLAV